MVHVDSEIGLLKRVLVHHPGQEMDWMVPTMMEELLFDDILYGKQARAEHEAFAQVLRLAGVEILQAEELLAEVLTAAETRDEMLETLERSEELPSVVREQLEGLEPSALAATLISGIRNPDAYRSSEKRLYKLAPIPNCFFQRDPQFVANRRVFFSSMATSALSLEPRLSAAIFRHHPKLGDCRSLFSISEDTLEAGFPVHGAQAHLAGGDVVIADARTLLVGVSERTDFRGVERLAEFLRCEDTSFQRLIVVDLPSRRSYMHLDTVFTFIDRGVGLAFLPVIEPGRRLSAQVFSVDLCARELTFSLRPSLSAALGEAGIDLQLVPCGGGDDVLDQAREQWTDGANAFAIAPGIILIYRRNRLTVQELAKRGRRIVEEEEILTGCREIFGRGPTVITIPGNELSRARGGPRCMTMPLERDPVPDP